MHWFLSKHSGHAASAVGLCLARPVLSAAATDTADRLTGAGAGRPGITGNAPWLASHISCSMPGKTVPRPILSPMLASQSASWWRRIWLAGGQISVWPQGWQGGAACTLLSPKDTRPGVLIGSSLAAVDGRATPAATSCSCHLKTRSLPCTRVVYGAGLAWQRCALYRMHTGLGPTYGAGHSGVRNASRLAYGATCSRWTSIWRPPWRFQGASNDRECEILWGS